jgi:hypothetical protein
MPFYLIDIYIQFKNMGNSNSKENEPIPSSNIENTKSSWGNWFKSNEENKNQNVSSTDSSNLPRTVGGKKRKGKGQRKTKKTKNNK